MRVEHVSLRCGDAIALKAKKSRRFAVITPDMAAAESRLKKGLELNNKMKEKMVKSHE